MLLNIQQVVKTENPIPIGFCVYIVISQFTRKKFFLCQNKTLQEANNEFNILIALVDYWPVSQAYFLLKSFFFKKNAYF